MLISELWATPLVKLMASVKSQVNKLAYLSYSKKFLLEKETCWCLRLYYLHTQSLALLSLQHTVLKKKINIVQAVPRFYRFVGEAVPTASLVTEKQ